jgi:hypothetical protein
MQFYAHSSANDCGHVPPCPKLRNTQFTCFTGTKVQMLTRYAPNCRQPTAVGMFWPAAKLRKIKERKLLSLLALLVQKYTC